MIAAAEAPCRMCRDTPCAQVCEPNVLSFEAPLKMGTARIETMDCLAWQGSDCSACWQQCPIPGAIAMESSKPTVVAQTCTGCGVCLHVCPAPRKAVMLLPHMDRPPWREATYDE